MSLQIRRGTAAELANITPVVGELIYTTDSQAVFVGDGSTAGGIPVAVGGSGNVSGTNLLTAGLVSAGGNVTGGNITTAGLISATGNVTGNYFLGNGSQLTGIVTSSTAITNGTSTVAIGASNGNANISINGTANVVVVSSTSVAVTGTVTATGNITGSYIFGNGSQLTGVTAVAVGTLPSLSVTGNITGGNLNTLGGQTTVGNIVGGNITTVGLISATGNITGANIIGNGSQLTGVTAVAVGTLSSLTVTGNIAGGNLSGTNITGSLATAAQANITSVGTLTSLSVSGNVQGGNLLTGGLISSTGNISTAGYLAVTEDINVGGDITSTSYTGSSMSLSGNVTGGNIRTGGVVSATGNLLTGGVVSATGNITGSYIFGNGSQLTGLITNTIQNGNSNVLVGSSAGNVSISVNGVSPVVIVTPTGQNITGTLDVTANVVGGNLVTAGQISSTGNITGGNVLGGANVNAITHTGTTVSVTGNITGGNITTAGILTVNSGNTTTAIVNGGGNAVGNIGSSSKYFNTVFAVATSAQYADLAENYESDQEYVPGTVVIFGGDKEITITSDTADERVAGVISTNPAHLMNAAMPGLAVALRGRVPVKVIGSVTKGDSLVTSSVAGYAQSVGRDRSYGQAVFAKALEDNNVPGEKIIQAVIL